MFDPAIYDAALPRDREPALPDILHAIRLAGGVPGNTANGGRALEVLVDGKVVETIWLGGTALVGK